MLGRLKAFGGKPRAAAEANTGPSVPEPDKAAGFNALVALADREFRAGRAIAAAGVVAIARDWAPALPLPGVLDVLATPSELPPERAAGFHLAQGQAYCLLGNEGAARTAFGQALSLDESLSIAHDALATFNLPGPDYHWWLERLYAHFLPRTLVEIGVSEGSSLALAPRDCLAIGIDQKPRHMLPFGPNTRIFAETSDAFFHARRIEPLLAGRPLDVGFIDGLHHFDQALRDFMNLEAYCDAGSVILIHDTIPGHEATQRRDRVTDFWTGDVWRLVPCLAAIRPELAIMTVATKPSGLTMVTGLDPRSTELARRYAEACATFGALPYSALQGREAEMLRIVPNDWNAVEPLLRGLKRAAERPV